MSDYLSAIPSLWSYHLSPGLLPWPSSWSPFLQSILQTPARLICARLRSACVTSQLQILQGFHMSFLSVCHVFPLKKPLTLGDRTYALRGGLTRSPNEWLQAQHFSEESCFSFRIYNLYFTHLSLFCVNIKIMAFPKVFMQTHVSEDEHVYSTGALSYAHTRIPAWEPRP